jgi:plasmid stabilization system protein ParE
MTQVRLTRGALDDIRRVLRRSEAEFGVAARTRYRILLDQALRDLAEDLPASAHAGAKPPGH